MIFDYVAAARRAEIPQSKLDRLVALLRAEFPDDETMAELTARRTRRRWPFDLDLCQAVAERG